MSRERDLVEILHIVNGFLGWAASQFNVEVHIGLVAIEPGAKEPLIAVGDLTPEEFQACNDYIKSGEPERIETLIEELEKNLVKVDDGLH